LRIKVSYGLIGIGIAFTTVVPTSVIITNWYGARRGTAMGFAFSGFALGEMLGNISAGFIVPHYGWRAGYLVSAVITAAIMIPVILLAIRTRPNTALENKGAQTEPTAIGSSAAFSWTCFASLLLLYFFYACVISVLIVHGVPYLISLGYAPERAAALFGLMLGCSFFGRNLAGILADKFGAVEALCGILVLIAASFIAFIFADRTSFLIIAMAGSALFCFSAPPVIPLLQAELLGVKNFGVLTGFLNTSSTIGYSIGPLFAGRVFDLTGRYDRAFEVAAACTLLGIGATLSARRCAVKDFSPSPSKEIKSSA
jgi:OFA family oxalate/formate antiporter-like MFS transporter